MDRSAHVAFPGYEGMPRPLFLHLRVPSPLSETTRKKTSALVLRLGVALRSNSAACRRVRVKS